MKNIVIGILVATVAVLGYFAFVKNKNSDVTKENSSQNSSEQAQNAPRSSGKTLDLANSGLNEVSKDLLDDSNVVVLNVSGNNLTGALPAEIRKLSNLEVLNASDNNLTGIPAEIGQLAKLKVANFANNNISGLPLEIGNLKNLETLDLRGNPNVSQYDISLIQPKIPNATILTD